VFSAAGSSIAPAVTEFCDVRGRGLRRLLDRPVRTLERFSHYRPELEEGPDDAGAEEACRREVALLLDAPDPYQVFRDERVKLTSEDPAATATAQAVARCAGWAAALG
jgi:hypothetical protein